MSGEHDRRGPPWLAALGLVLLLACARLYLGDLASFAGAQDLDFFDESHYLAAGIFAHGLHDLNAQWAPPYCLWYRLLFHFGGDALAAYHLNAWLLAYALPLSWYLLCIALRIAPLWALTSALAWLLSAANLATLRVGNFAACIVLGALTLAALARRQMLAWWLAAAGLWLAALVRPELTWAALALLPAAVWKLRRAGHSARTLALWSAGALAPAAAFWTMFGLPFGGGRSIAAFQQHLAGNILEWHALPFDDWIHYEDVIRRYYALPDSIGGFIRREPLAFAHHVLTNLWRLATQALGSALRPPDFALQASHALALAPVTLCLGAAALLLVRGRRLPAPAITPVSVALGASSAMTLAACAVIYPREHYLPLLLCSVLLLIAPRAAERPARAWPGASGMLAIALLVALLPAYAASRGDPPRPQELAVRALRTLQAGRELTLFDGSGILHLYLQPPARRLGPRDLDESFDRFVRDHRIDVVVISPQLLRDPVLRADAQWGRFVAAPATLGFACDALAGTDWSLCAPAAPAPAGDPR